MARVDPAALYDCIPDFLDELRIRHGFNIGLEQYIATRDLLLALAAHRSLPESDGDAADYLGPILCSSARDQENFHEFLANWLQRERFRVRRPVREIGLLAPEREDVEEREETSWGEAIRQHGVSGQTYVLALAAMVAIVTLFPFTTRDTQLPAAPTPPVITELPPQTVDPLLESRSEPLPPSPRAELPVSPSVDPTHVEAEPLESAQRLFALYWPTLVPVSLFGIWFWRRMARRRLWLDRHGGSKAADLTRFRVIRGTRHLFAGPPLRPAFQALRTHRVLESTELDTDATVARTVKNAGYFTPVYDTRLEMPEYLVLIDQDSAVDQRARMMDEFIDRLRFEGISVDRFHFHGDAQSCYRDDRDQTHMPLERLFTRHHRHRLVIFSDGEGFFHPVSGQPQPWGRNFMQWPQRALVTPNSPLRWGYRERVFDLAGFSVVPTTTEGLRSLADGFLQAQEE